MSEVQVSLLFKGRFASELQHDAPALAPDHGGAATRRLVQHPKYELTLLA
jgi:hypothetical protein